MQNIHPVPVSHYKAYETLLKRSLKNNHRKAVHEINKKILVTKLKQRGK